MKQVRLGRTGLMVDAACLGSGGHSRLGQQQGASEAQSIAVVQAALDLGVTIIDTAPAYKTEAIVGAALKGRRERAVISTKVTIGKGGDPDPVDNLIDAVELKRSVERSLADLATDRIDILHLHGVSPQHYDHCRTELLPALLDLRKAGKIRFTGVTERFKADTGHVMLNRAIDDGVWDVIMVGLNLVNQTALAQVLPRAKARDIGTMAMFAVRGALARPDRAKALVADLVKRGEVDAGAIDAANPLGFVLAEGGARTLSEAAYRYCRHAPGIDVVMTGTGNVAHLEENVRSIHGAPLPDAVTRRLAALFGRVTSATGDPVSH